MAKYLCTSCGRQAHNSIQYTKVQHPVWTYDERNRLIQATNLKGEPKFHDVSVRGLGTWNCPCTGGKVTVRAIHGKSQAVTA